MGFLNVGNVMFTIWEYPVSYVEFAGTLLYFASTFLIARKNLWTWPTGIASVILYFFLFYQIQLYSDMLEQIYYLVISIIGWITWQKVKAKEDKRIIRSRWSSKKELVLWAVGITVCTAGLSLVSGNLHRWLPGIFPAPADYPVLDALTTVMSFAAMYLLTMKRNESWLYWMIVNVIGIWLYWVKGVHFIAIQYIFLLANAVHGLIHWLRQPPSASLGNAAN